MNKTVLFSENIKPSEYRIIIYLNIDEKPFLGKSFDEKVLKVNNYFKKLKSCYNVDSKWYQSQLDEIQMGIKESFILNYCQYIGYYAKYHKL